jgi:ubiquinone/menaquinone biosynthesis C-methylase UbiE
MMKNAEIDHQKAEAFAERLVGVLNDAGLAMMTSIGHRTGLFDRMAALPASTSQEIADAAGLNERYVREWLGAMVTGGFIRHDADAETYWLPPEHAAALVRSSGPDNLAAQMQWVACLGGVETGIVECFEKGGGVPYSAFERFHEIMSGESGPVIDQTLVQTTLPLVPGLVQRLEEGIDVVDVGCGSGHAINVMARAFPKSRFTGYDISEAGIASGRAEANEWGLANSRFEVQDAAAMSAHEMFDLITTFDSVHDQVDPAAMLSGIHRALRLTGTYLMVDIKASSHLHENLEHPMGPFLYTASTMHCMTVSLAGGGAGLGTCWGEQTARRMLTEAGFTNVELYEIEGDIINSYFAARKN